MKTGWIKIDRKLLNNPLWDDKPFSKGQAWIDMLMLAAWQRKEIYVHGVRVTLEIGDICMSVREFCERWGWSDGKVNRFLSVLKMGQLITERKSHVTNTISIVNYKKYQTNNVTDGATDRATNNVTDGATLYIEESKEIKNININSLSNAHTREEKEKLGFVAFGDFQNVYLKPSQRRTLDERFGEEKTQACIDDLSCRLEEGNDENLNNSRSHYATLLHWLQYQQQRPVAGYQRELKVDLNALK